MYYTYAVYIIRTFVLCMYIAHNAQTGKVKRRALRLKK